MTSPSQAQYRQVVQHYAREGAISPRVRQVLERQRQWLKLLPHEAQAIEQSVLQNLQAAEPKSIESNLVAESIAPSLDLSNLSIASGSNDPILIPVSASLRLRISVAVEPTSVTVSEPSNDSGSVSEPISVSVPVSISAPVPTLIESEPTEEKQLAIEAAKPTLALPESAESLMNSMDLEEQAKPEDFKLPEDLLPEDLNLENWENFDLEEAELESLGLEQADVTNLLSLLSENPSDEELQSVISRVTAAKAPQPLEQPIDDNSLIYHRNRERYRAEFKTLMYQQYPQPLSEADRSELKQLQQNLQIADEDVTAIEAQVIAELHQNIVSKASSTSDSQSAASLVSSSENATEHFLENSNENPQVNDVAPAPPQKQSEQDYFATPIEQVINPEIIPAAPEDKRDEPVEQPPVVSDSSADIPSFTGNILSQLEDKLYNQQWREADRTTFTLMLHLAKQNRWLDEQALKAITDKAAVQEIDRLWRQYSQSYLSQEFGFRMQCSIYQSLKPAKTDRRIARQAKPQQAIEFVTKVGWWTPRLNCFRFYEQLDFPTPNASNTVRPGHLPALWFWAIPSLESFRLGGIGTGLGGCRLMVERLDGMLTQLDRLL